MTIKNFQNEEEALKKYEQDLIAQDKMNQNASAYNTANMFSGQQKQNLVEWQLDFRPELEDIERLLRNDIFIRDKDNNEFWIANPDKSKVFFNSVGVNDILREIRMFLNKNKVLSNYTHEEIGTRVKMIQHEIRVLIYNNYEYYGMDNEYKVNNYSIIVLTIGSMIEDAYRRSMGGEERRGLNETRFVNQNEPMGPSYPMGGGYNQMSQGSNKRPKWYAPWTWGR